MNIPENPSLELSRMQKRLLYWQVKFEDITLSESSQRLADLDKLLSDYSTQLNSLSKIEDFSNSQDKWAEAENTRQQLESSFQEALLESRRDRVLPEIS